MHYRDEQPVAAAEAHPMPEDMLVSEQPTALTEADRRFVIVSPGRTDSTLLSTRGHNTRYAARNAARAEVASSPLKAARLMRLFFSTSRRTLSRRKDRDQQYSAGRNTGTEKGPIRGRALSRCDRGGR